MFRLSNENSVRIITLHEEGKHLFYINYHLGFYPFMAAGSQEGIDKWEVTRVVLIQEVTNNGGNLSITLEALRTGNICRLQRYFYVTCLMPGYNYMSGKPTHIKS